MYAYASKAHSTFAVCWRSLTAVSHDFVYLPVALSMQSFAYFLYSNSWSDSISMQGPSQDRWQAPEEANSDVVLVKPEPKEDSPLSSPQAPAIARDLASGPTQQPNDRSACSLRLMCTDWWWVCTQGA